jgi:exopolysaccharide biosynthesis polyprenyl glycosylphosphotransferase
VIVGDSERGELVAKLLESQLSWGHRIVGRVTLHQEELGRDAVLGGLDELPRVLLEQPVDDVVFAVRSRDSLDLKHYLNLCKQMGIPVKILPSLWNPGELIPISAERYQGVPFLVIKRGRFNATGLLYKRILDLMGGVMGGLLFLLIYPFVAVAIKRDSSGPVLFKQQRVGQNGRIFTLYKFRSMYIDAEERKQELLQQNEMQGAMFKLREDPRITKVGQWLRKSSLDEFPQFLNVLKGEMSLVGTRPPTPDEVAHYETFHRRRISAKPGITGLWQVSGRNRIKDFDRVVELDCQYLDNWRFLDDLQILVKTIWVVLKRKGAL